LPGSPTLDKSYNSEFAIDENFDKPTGWNWMIMSYWWFGTFGLFFHSVGNVMIPTDFRIFQRGRYTTNQVLSVVSSSWTSRVLKRDWKIPQQPWRTREINPHEVSLLLKSIEIPINCWRLSFNPLRIIDA